MEVGYFCCPLRNMPLPTSYTVIPHVPRIEHISSGMQMEIIVPPPEYLELPVTDTGRIEVHCMAQYPNRVYRVDDKSEIHYS
jgi:hypothetical protein